MLIMGKHFAASLGHLTTEGRKQTLRESVDYLYDFHPI